MTKKPRHNALPLGAARPNFLAVLITCSAIGVLVLNFQLEPAKATARKNLSRPIIKQIAPRPAETTQSDETTADGVDASEEIDAATPALPGAVCRGRIALLLNLALLEDGIRLLESCPNYTATFYKQEWLEDKGELTDIQTIQFKARHEPFSVYLQWLNADAGREVLYVEGENDDKMVVHAGSGLKSRITLKIAPDSSLAMGEARHPITQAGLLYLARKMVNYRRSDLAHADQVECCMGAEQLFNDRPCYSFTLNFKEGYMEANYRKSVILIDKEYSIPVLVQNFEWYDTQDEEMAKLSPEDLDAETFIEYYAYSDINLNAGLKRVDFDRENPAYRF